MIGFTQQKTAAIEAAVFTGATADSEANQPQPGRPAGNMAGVSA
ncbi:MAG: hypothetical protein WBZ31_04020 [Thiobacillus sp.]